MKIEIISNLEVRNRQGDLTDSQSGYFDRKNHRMQVCAVPHLLSLWIPRKRDLFIFLGILCEKVPRRDFLGESGSD